MDLRRVLADQVRFESTVKHVVYERAFSGTRHSGYDRHSAERDADVNVLKIVLTRSGESDPPRPQSPSLRRDGDAAHACNVLSGKRTLTHTRHGSREHDLAAGLSAS